MICPICNKILQPKQVALNNKKYEYNCFDSAKKKDHLIAFEEDGAVNLFHIFYSKDSVEEIPAFKIFWNYFGWIILHCVDGSYTEYKSGRDQLTLEEGHKLLMKYVNLWCFT